jgi:transposase
VGPEVGRGPAPGISRRREAVIDYAGNKIPVYDRQSGDVDFRAPLFVAVLGASNYTFAEATRTEDLSCWIGSHIRALEFLGGTPELAIPDNTKTGVKHPCRYEPELNATYRELAGHYGFAVIPTRPYKPRDKAKAEAGVQVAQRWIVAALRHRKFFHLSDLNEAIGDLLDRLNNRPFRKRPELSRTILFEQLDRPALKPLPAERYVLAQWKPVKPNIDYHVEIERHYYSVPYQLVGQLRPVRHDDSFPGNHRFSEMGEGAGGESGNGGRHSSHPLLADSR